MDRRTYDKLRRIVYDQSGIDLQEGKMSLVAARLAKRLRELDVETEAEYLEYLEGALDTEVVQLLDVMTTNVTSFYREAHHFEVVREAMKGWLANGQSRFRAWSSACSTGEEPYTLAMTMVRSADGAGPTDLRILATDISTRVLAEAEAGVYPSDRVQAIPDDERRRFLTAAGGDHCVDPALKKLVVFKRMNLSQPPFRMRGPLDFIFCRNVMIYFDQRVRDALVKEFHRLLRPDGYLMVGHAESLAASADLFTRAGSSVYRPIKADDDTTAGRG